MRFPGAFHHEKVLKMSTGKMIELYQTGMKATEIARRAGTNAVTVANRLRRAGVETRGRRKKRERDQAQMPNREPWEFAGQEELLGD